MSDFASYVQSVRTMNPEPPSRGSDSDRVSDDFIRAACQLADRRRAAAEIPPMPSTVQQQIDAIRTQAIADLNTARNQKKQEGQLARELDRALFATADRIHVPSSNLATVAYHAEMEILRVQFKTNSVYLYFAVPKSAFDGLLTADSKGKYLNSSIKPKHKYALVPRKENA